MLHTFECAQLKSYTKLIDDKSIACLCAAASRKTIAYFHAQAVVNLISSWGNIPMNGKRNFIHVQAVDTTVIVCVSVRVCLCVRACVCLQIFHCIASIENA